MNTNMERNTAQQLADEAYETGNPIMSDALYDATFGDTSTHHKLDLKKGPTSLPIWMGSLDKKRNEKSLQAWLDKASTDKFVISAKLDGISALYDPYDNKLYTRGNGQVGCDISRFIKHLDLKQPKIAGKAVLDIMIDAIPENMWSESESKVYVRGELIMPNSIFEKKYKKDFKNPRNLVSGQFGKSVINKNIIADISFVYYEVIISDNNIQCPMADQLYGNNQLPWIEITRSDISVDSLTTLLDEWKQKCEFAIDGLVVTENRMYTRNMSDNPKYSIAFKKETNVEPAAVTNVIDVSWNVSRWGFLKPVVNIEPVHLSDVTIKKCAGHNAKYILDNKIGPGAQIMCVRSGEVIPYIVSVVKPAPVDVTLPSSTWKGRDLVKEDSNNEIEIKTLTNIFSKLEVKNVNEKTIKKMYTCGLNTLPKMLNCTKEDLQPTFKDKSADRILNEIGALKNRSVKVSSLVGAAGVLGFGLGVKRVENLFSHLPTLRSGDWETLPTVDDVCGVNGFSKNMSEKVVRCFPNMTAFLQMCTHNGLQLDMGHLDAPLDVAERTRICLSGFRDDGLKQKYTVLSSVTKECQVLVCKSFEKETDKMKKAKKLGVKMVLLRDFTESNLC